MARFKNVLKLKIKKCIYVLSYNNIKVRIMKCKLREHGKGQYFTKNEYLKNCVFSLISNNPSTILEPSVGRGDLVKHVQDHWTSSDDPPRFVMYEIDDNLECLVNKKDICFTDFLKVPKNETFDTIIGNPPYVKTSSKNMYIQFIEKCVEWLNPNGELIFIVPSDFIKLTSSVKLLQKMLKSGTFTDIIYPHDERLFENASIDVIIFRYCKNPSLEKKAKINGVEKYLNNQNGIITFTDDQPSSTRNTRLFSDYFDVYVGMVTGKEDVYKNKKYGNIDILNGKSKKERYILINQYPTDNNSLNEYLLEHKSELISRKIRKFSEKNWFEWGALRNYTTIQEHLGEDCIFVQNITRQKEICFLDKVQYFGGGLIILIPKRTLPVPLSRIVEYINSDIYKENYMYSGRFKIGHNQIKNSVFPSHLS